MSFYDAIRVGASGAADTAFTVDRSLRFNDNDSAYLQRTPSSASNRRTFTFSFWVKRANLGMYTHMFGIQYSSSANQFVIRFDNDDRLTVFDFQTPLGGMQMRKTSEAVFRDVSAWYHIVAAIDTTQSTGSYRNRVYVNNVELTEFDNENTPSQNHDTVVNTTNTHYIGQKNSSNYFDGYLAEFHFIDGQQLTPSSFGETNATTGQWIPKDTSELNYGTNGYRLQFADNSGTTATTLGKDTSGNSNNYTPNNFSVAAGVGNDSVEDTPTNNFCTLNAVAKGSGVSLSQGNLGYNSSGREGVVGTFAVRSGKWYWEVTASDVGADTQVGIYDNTDGKGFPTSYLGVNTSSWGVISGNGNTIHNTSQASYGSSFSDGDILMVALDMDNGKWYLGKNGSWYNSGNPASSTNPAHSGITSGTGLISPAISNNTENNMDYQFNFGQRAFSYTPPTGYKKLNSANLPDPTILLPNNHFNTVLYSGDGNATKSITGVGFKPDWLWLKGRNTSYSHLLYDAVRGAGSLKALNSNLNRPEGSTVQDDSTFGFLNSFDSDGFSVTKGSDSTSYTNGGSSTYVAWNWNAGDTDGATYTVKVVSDSGNKYRFNDFGTSAVTLDLAEGGTYTFDGSDSSMSGHPFVIGTAANGSEYSTGVTYQLDGASVTYSQYTSGYSSATTRKLIITVPASAPQLYYWCSIHSGMGGAINTNSTLGSSNFDGTIQSVAKVNAAAGFSILKYTGTGSNATIGHGLGVAPDAIFVKRRNGTQNWGVYHSSIAPNDIVQLDVTNAVYGGSGVFGNALATSSVFSVNAGSGMSNGNGDTYVAYCFSEVEGYSKFGKYTGNGSSDGPFVFTGFRPAMVIIKCTSNTENWYIIDNKRPEFNGALGSSGIMKWLKPNTGDSENQNGLYNFLSNGFKLGYPGADTNASGRTYIYLAFAEASFKNARAR